MSLIAFLLKSILKFHWGVLYLPSSLPPSPPFVHLYITLCHFLTTSYTSQQIQQFAVHSEMVLATQPANAIQKEVSQVEIVQLGNNVTFIIFEKILI